MTQNAGAAPLPTAWEKLLPILGLGTGGKKYSFDFHTLPLSTAKEVVLVLVIYLTTLVVLRVRKNRGNSEVKSDGSEY